MASPESHKNIPIEIHFLSESISLQEGEETRESKTVQAVRSGQLLVSLAQADNASGASSKKKQQDVHIRLVAAENCEVSAGGRSILSVVAGYPHIDIKDEDGQQVVTVSVTPLVIVSEDAMKAGLTLFPPVNGAPALQVEDLQLILKEAGVVYGIDTRFLQKGLERVAREKQPVTDLIVARGMPPLNGFDAHLRMEVEIGSIPGKVRGDGTIDFRERRMFVSVEEGQLIAKKIRETKGIPGQNVLGQAIPQKEGRDITVRVTEDAVYNEEDRTVRALKAGVVSIVKDSVIKVSSKQSITGDVDFNTGNIYSKSALEIGGSVKQGFVVAVRGDVLIGQDVQSATVSSHGNLVVKGGIVGADSNVNIRGDVDLNFIENGTVHAGGNVVIRKSSYYSTIIADGNISGDEKTKIVGGVLVCSGSVTAGDIGSMSADPASIAVGTDVKRYQHYNELHQKVIELEEETALWLQRHGSEAEKSAKMIEKERELIEARTELAALNLIPGSPADSMSGDFTVDDDAEIIVSGQIFMGTVLRIGNLTRKVVLNQSKKRFRIDQKTNTIVDVSL
jgi:uncharacterized protein